MAGSSKPTLQRLSADIWSDVKRTKDPYSCRQQAVARARKACDGKHDKSSSSYASCMRYNMKRKTLELCWKGFMEDRVAAAAKVWCVGVPGTCTKSTEKKLADLIDPVGYVHQTTAQKRAIAQAAVKEARAEAEAARAAAEAEAARVAAEASVRAAEEAEKDLPLYAVFDDSNNSSSSSSEDFQVKPWHVGVGVAALVGIWYYWGRK